MTNGTPSYSGLPEWPTNDPQRRTAMELNVDSRLVDDPDADKRRMWDGVRVD